MAIPVFWRPIYLNRFDSVGTIIQRINFSAEIMAISLRAVLDFISLDAAGEVTLNLDSLTVGDTDNPASGDFRWVVSRGTTDTITIYTEEYDGTSWLRSGTEDVVTTDDVEVRFNTQSGGSSSVTISHGYNADAFRWRNAWAFDDTQSAARAPFQSLVANDATPDVDGAVCWKTTNSVATTITAFDHANNIKSLKHLFILLIDDANTTIDFSQAGLEGNNGVSWAANQGDMLLCVRGGGTSPVTSCIVPAQKVVPAIAEVKGGSITVTNVTSTVVTHGMTGTPTSVNIMAKDQAASDWEDVPNTPFISAITSTTFTISWDGNLGVGNRSWYWMAVVN